MNKKPEVVMKNGKKMWLMPDGGNVPYIAGGSDDEPTVDELKERLSALEEKSSKASSDAIKYRTKLRELESTYDGFNVDEYKSLKEAAKNAEEKKALEQGEYERLLSEKESAFNDEKSNLLKENEKWKSMYEGKVINDNISSLSKANNAVNDKDLITIIKSEYNIQLDEKGSVKVLKGDEVATDGKGNELSLDAIVKSTLEDRPYLVKSADAGAGVKPGQNGKSEEPLNSGDLIKKGLEARGYGQ